MLLAPQLLLLQAEDGRTRMTLTPGPFDDAIHTGAQAGWTAAVAGLDRLLARARG